MGARKRWHRSAITCVRVKHEALGTDESLSMDAAEVLRDPDCRNAAGVD